MFRGEVCPAQQQDGGLRDEADSGEQGHPLGLVVGGWSSLQILHGETQGEVNTKRNYSEFRRRYIQNQLNQHKMKGLKNSGKSAFRSYMN